MCVCVINSFKLTLKFGFIVLFTVLTCQTFIVIKTIIYFFSVHFTFKLLQSLFLQITNTTKTTLKV